MQCAPGASSLCSPGIRSCNTFFKAPDLLVLAMVRAMIAWVLVLMHCLPQATLCVDVNRLDSPTLATPSPLLQWRVRRTNDTSVPVIHTPSCYNYEPTVVMLPWQPASLSVWTCSNLVHPNNFDSIALAVVSHSWPLLKLWQVVACPTVILASCC